MMIIGIFSAHNGLKLEIKYMDAKQHATKQRINQEIEKEIKNV